MYEFIMGMLVGYILYPVSQMITTIFTNAWYASKGCTGSCDQGRRPCNCKEKQNGVS